MYMYMYNIVLQVGGSHVIALMELEGVPLPSLNPDEEGWSWVSLDSNRISPLCLELKGIAEVPLQSCTST